MSGTLAASLVAVGRPSNTAVQDDTVSIRLTHPPSQATDVTIEIFQEDPGRLVVAFSGDIRGGKLINPLAQGNLKVSPNTDRPDDITLTFDVDGFRFRAMMLDPAKFVTAHKLRVAVTGVIDAKRKRFIGHAPLHVFYKMAMIVPSGPAKDPALTVLPKWAQQWKAHQPAIRTIVPLDTIPAVTGNISEASYDPLIAAVTAAAKAASHGIVALAVGHGDPGKAYETSPWCDLVAEDGKIDEHNFKRGLYIDFLELRDGDPDPGPIRPTPGGTTRVKLNALDRIADVFAKHPVRAFLLHTCSAGKSTKFMQRMANRLRVFVRGHEQPIEYEGDTVGTIRAHYVGNAFPATAKYEWPTAHIGREFAPASPPPERFPI